MILCDTDVIIEILKGNEKVIQKILEIGLENISVSSITVMELYFGAFDKRELNKIKKYLNLLDIIQFDTSISEKSIQLIELYSKSHALQIPDAVIAATSIIKKWLIAELWENIKGCKKLGIMEIKRRCGD